MGGRKWIGLLLGISLLFGAPVPALADHDDGVYELASIAMWNEARLDVVVVPPNHGQIYNPDKGLLNGSDPNELGPFNSYLAAIEDSIDAWDKAIAAFAADRLAQNYEATVYVVGRDQIPQEVLMNPDILVVTDENGGGSLGTAIRLPTCVVRVAKFNIFSFSYADMYNVTAQEFGHCLGLRHVGGQGGIDPTSELKHPEHDVMNGFYTHLPGEAGTHLHCISNLDIFSLEGAFELGNPNAPNNLGNTVIAYMPVDLYGDTCIGPPDDWRERMPNLIYEGGVTVRSEIDKPSSGDSIKVKRLKTVSGTASSSGTRPFKVEVAISRLEPDGNCAWWDDLDKRFVVRDCYSPVWEESGGSLWWKYRLEGRLPRGDYTVWSRVVEPYNHEVDFEPGRNRIEITLI